jgi:hypothetical protein
VLLLLYMAHERTEPGMSVQQWFHLASFATGKSGTWIDQLLMIASM